RQVQRSYRKTSAMLTWVMGTDRLLARHPELARSIEVRTRYVDVLNRLQVKSLRKLRSSRGGTEWSKTLALTISGIAAGMRNTG
ncbi:MAG: phosphoenolpyruvate carboxylase, partial [Bdellovibrionaceae bacterium]|nr:phosphoenolpyruvate carboxylase [Pseudobdellovibrionaceae bacterium]